MQTGRASRRLKRTSVAGRLIIVTNTIGIPEQSRHANFEQREAVEMCPHAISLRNRAAEHGQNVWLYFSARQKSHTLAPHRQLLWTHKNIT